MMPAVLNFNCPFCKKEKSIMYSASYNTFHGHQWSDTKSSYKIEVFPVQKCNSCGKYCFLNDQETRESGIGPTYKLVEERVGLFRRKRFKEVLIHEAPAKIDDGDLSYPEVKEAIEQLYSEELDDDHIYGLLISFLRAYNDWFFRKNKDDENKKIETDEDIKFFNKYVEKLYKVIPENNVIFRGELLREMGKFDECIELLKNKKLGDVEFVKNQVLEHAKKHDKNMFCIEKHNS